MKICRFCEKIIAEQDEVCGNCGYNSRTDTMTASFVKKKEKITAKQKQGVISPRVKSFVFWGMLAVVLSLGIKYQGKLGDIIWKVKNKSAPASGKVKPNKAIGLIDVRTYKAPAHKTPGKNKRIEGIFYDPQGKSCVMISGQLISEQMSFGDMVIKKINRDSVEVFQDGRLQVLRVSK